MVDLQILCRELDQLGDGHALSRLRVFVIVIPILNSNARGDDPRGIADLHAWHILVEEREGARRVTGHIDLGDVEVGPVEYEWVPLCQKAFQGNETLMHAFFTAYGWHPAALMPVPPDVI
jgi:hypothetical protein